MKAEDENARQPISEALAAAILEKASQLYQQQTAAEGYSLEQLVAAGAEVQIPPALVRQAYAQIQQAQRRAAQQKRQRQKRLKRGSAIAVALSVMGALWVGSVYNGLTAAKTSADSQWAQVENQLQRRADLIPQLVQIAESYAEREERVIQNLSTARDTFLSATTIAEQRAANVQMQAAIAEFQAFAASREPLRSSELLINLQYETAGTENRIAAERRRYNQAVASYNQAVQTFPNSLIARLLGFQPRSFFESTRP
ncbi:MAG: LemA family protein [Leptolyngbya sp. SIO4C1]|nr:LemA family protein [Leptolyngbya sp. SIO4C1]